MNVINSDTNVVFIYLVSLGSHSIDIGHVLSNTIWLRVVCNAFRKEIAG
jgi:hypothetical protein